LGAGRGTKKHTTLKSEDKRSRACCVMRNSDDETQKKKGSAFLQKVSSKNADEKVLERNVGIKASKSKWQEM